MRDARELFLVFFLLFVQTLHLLLILTNLLTEPAVLLFQGQLDTLQGLDFLAFRILIVF